MNNVHYTTLAGAVRANRAEFEAAVRDGVREGMMSVGAENLRTSFFDAEGMFDTASSSSEKKAA